MDERLSNGAGISTPFPELLCFCMDAELDGRPAVETVSVRSKLVQFAARESGLRHTAQRALTSLSRGETPGPENSIGKRADGSTLQEISAFALDVQGLSGAVWDETSPQNGPFQDDCPQKALSPLLRPRGTGPFAANARNFA
jgi:acyl-CoA dehydrogenase